MAVPSKPLHGPNPPAIAQSRAIYKKLASRPVVTLLAVLSAGGALALAVAEASGHQVDFDIYRMGAGQLFGKDLYTVRLSRALMGGSVGMHFTYPPFAALLIWPFAFVSIRFGQVIWSVLNLGALFGLVAASLHAVRPQWTRATTCAVAAVALFPVVRLNPDVLTLDLGQVNFWIVLLAFTDLSFTFRLGKVTLPRGVLLGIAAAVKLTPLIFIPFLMLTRQFRAACTATGAFGICTLAALLGAPYSSLRYWSTEIFDDRRSGNLLYVSDQNLHSAIQRILGAPPSALLVDVLTVVAACGGLAVAVWAYRSSSPMLGIVLCAATGLIISPVSWIHHYVWVVPVLAWLALAADRPGGGHWWALGLAALCWAAPMWWIPDPQTGYGGPLVLLASNSLFLAAVAFLVLAALMLTLRRRKRLAAAASELVGTNNAQAPAAA